MKHPHFTRKIPKQRFSWENILKINAKMGPKGTRHLQSMKHKRVFKKIKELKKRKRKQAFKWSGCGDRGATKCQLVSVTDG